MRRDIVQGWREGKRGWWLRFSEPGLRSHYEYLGDEAEAAWRKAREWGA